MYKKINLISLKKNLFCRTSPRFLVEMVEKREKT